MHIYAIGDKSVWQWSKWRKLP